MMDGTFRRASWNSWTQASSGLRTERPYRDVRSNRWTGSRSRWWSRADAKCVQHSPLTSRRGEKWLTDNFLAPLSGPLHHKWNLDKILKMKLGNIDQPLTLTTAMPWGKILCACWIKDCKELESSGTIISDSGFPVLVVLRCDAGTNRWNAWTKSLLSTLICDRSSSSLSLDK